MKLNYYQVNPPPPLSGIVRHFWFLEGSGINNPFIHRALADCSAELIFYYQGSFRVEDLPGKLQAAFGSGIFGQTSHYRTFTASSDFGIFGIYLYPFAMRLLHQALASELSNEMFEISQIFGSEGLRLEERIFSAKNNRARI